MYEVFCLRTQNKKKKKTRIKFNSSNWKGDGNEIKFLKNKPKIKKCSANLILDALLSSELRWYSKLNSRACSCAISLIDHQEQKLKQMKAP